MIKASAVQRRGVNQFPAILMFLVTYFVARAVLDAPGVSTGLRVTAAILPVPAFVWFLVGFHRSIQQMDELERLIQLRALAFAFPATWVLLLTLGLLELAVELPAGDLSYRHVWALMPILYFAGVLLAKRRFEPQGSE